MSFCIAFRQEDIQSDVQTDALILVNFLERIQNKSMKKINSEYGINLLVIIYHFFLMGFCLYYCRNLYFESLVVIGVQFLLFFYQEKIEQFPLRIKFLIQSIGLALFMWFNYQIVGVIDRGLGGLPVYDGIFTKVDEFIFRAPSSVFFQQYILNYFGDMGRKILYDLLMFSYLLYYLMPFAASFLYIEQSRLQERKEFIASVYILFLFIFTFYLIVPVTGPQYFLESYFKNYEAIPFSSVGRFIYKTIYDIQPNYIDCFPSGHAGIAFLVCYWAYKANFREKHLFLLAAILILFSTILLRFHYMLDVLASIPFVIISSYLGASIDRTYKTSKTSKKNGQ